jgi:GntR family transcriptional regulator
MGGMPCTFKINPSGGVPIYRQLMDQVMAQIASGRLKGGDMLPSVRELSALLEINPMTVSKAYSLLHKEGLLERLPGAGMAVSGKTRSKLPFEDACKLLEPLLNQLLVQARQAGLSKEQLTRRVEKLWEGSGDGRD